MASLRETRDAMFAEDVGAAGAAAGVGADVGADVGAEVGVSIHDSCLIITDGWAPGMTTGDVDDIPAMINAARMVENPCFYILNPDRYEALERIGVIAMIQKINPRATFYTPSSSKEEIEQCFSVKKVRNIIIIGPIGPADPILLEVLQSRPSYKGFTVWAQGVGTYNFSGTIKSLDEFETKGAITHGYKSNTVNRRITFGELLPIISDINVPPEDTKRLLEIMKMYALGKLMCLPTIPQVALLVPGWFVQTIGLANNIKGLLSFLGIPFTKSPNDAVLKYIQEQDKTGQEHKRRMNESDTVEKVFNPAVRGRNIAWVQERIAKITDPTVFPSYQLGRYSEEQVCEFYEAYALVVDTFGKYAIRPSNDPSMPKVRLTLVDFRGKLPTLADLYKMVTFYGAPNTSITSPMWDLFCMMSILQGITDDDIDKEEKTETVNLMAPPSSYMLGIVHFASYRFHPDFTGKVLSRRAEESRGAEESSRAERDGGRKRRKTKRKAIRKSSNRSVRRQSTRKRKTYKRR